MPQLLRCATSPWQGPILQKQLPRCSCQQLLIFLSLLMSVSGMLKPCCFWLLHQSWPHAQLPHAVLHTHSCKADWRAAVQAGAVQGLTARLSRAASPSALSSQQADQEAQLSIKALSAIVQGYPAAGQAPWAWLSAGVFACGQAL